ncbi:MASE1 domain-containing protein [Azohydromonas australica]|uniref:MASE1 domain-containing protein n=1 Tax=Azohydromonas australica TaxID=364039 RepID=UPI000402624C|nr:MASE1 domain-containing protein [Azohydromonas australica]
MSVFVATYLLGAWGGQALFIAPDLGAALWPPSGLFLAALLLCANSRRPWFIVVGAVTDFVASFLIFGFPAGLSVAIAVGNTLEAAAGAYLLRRWTGSDFRLEGTASVFAFTLLAALASPLLSTAVGGTAMSFHTGQPLLSAWKLWWTGDAVGVLIFTPLVLFLFRKQRAAVQDDPPAGLAEIILMLCVLLLGGHVVWLPPYPNEFFLLPVLIWIALRGEFLTIVFANFLVTLQAVLYTQHGYGSFASDPSLETRQLLTQSFIMAAALTGLVLAGQACQRRKSILELQAARNAAEAALASAERARASAEEASRVKSQFLANMSHEFRTPLNAVIGLSHLLHQRAMPADMARFVTHIQHAGEQLLALTNDVLDLSRIEAGELRLEDVPFALMPLLDAVQAMVRTQADAKSLPLWLDVAAGVPPRLVGDPLRLRQVLLNLLGNAVKFTAAGQVTLRLEVVAREAGWIRLRFEVADTGIGIAAEQQQRIFEPFVQGDSSTTRRFGGTGLGLSIVRRLVDLMGGTLQLQSQPGQGSVFSVELPFRVG